MGAAVGDVLGLAAGLAGGEQAVALAVFVTLEGWKTWASTHDAVIMTVLFLVFGFKLVGDGIAVLS